MFRKLSFFLIITKVLINDKLVCADVVFYY
jgi:hypothetical protein